MQNFLQLLYPVKRTRSEEFIRINDFSEEPSQQPIGQPKDLREIFRIAQTQLNKPPLNLRGM